MAAKSKQQKEQAAVEAQAAPSPCLKPSSFIDTCVVYCGDNLEQLKTLPDSMPSISEKKMNNQLVSLAIAGALLSGCGRNEPAKNNGLNANTNLNQSQSLVQYETPEISSEGRKLFETLDKNTLTNLPGFNVDFDGDGTIDFVTMSDNTLYYSKGLGNDKFGREIPIVKLKGTVVAYSIRSTPDQSRPYLVFFDEKDNGYMQPNLGTNSLGIPYLGDVEELGEKRK
jgi:hypothetical protein